MKKAKETQGPGLWAGFPFLLVFLHALAGHSVDDAVSTGVDEPHAPCNEEEGHNPEYDSPEYDVEKHGVVLSVSLSQVEII